MKKTQPLHLSAFALSAGLVWGLAMFLLALFSMKWGWGDAWTTLLSNVYIGMEATVKGAFAGLVWGFVDMFVGAFAFAWLYNFFSKKL
jgi:hypothetical protein